MSKPRLLDLFCGAGGATAGYQHAGFEVVGVDIKPQPNYCGERFVQAPFSAIALHGRDGWIADVDGLRLFLGHFDAIHASPPCQRYSSITKVRGAERVNSHPDLVEPTRFRLRGSGIPYVIENVVGAPLIDPIMLCGSQFGLAITDGELRRHRLFECSFPIVAPPHQPHRRGGLQTLGIYGGGTRQDTRKRKNTGGGNTQKANKAQAQALMGIDWMTREEMCQAIPPAYTEFVGTHLMAAVAA